MTAFQNAVFSEDGYADGNSDINLHIGLSLESDLVTLSTEGDWTLPPTYWTPDRARAIAAALLEAARICDGTPAEGLFGAQP